MASLAPEELQSLRAQAAKHLEEAEAEKAAADFALGNLKGREDQIREIRQHSETYIQNEISGRVPEDSLLNSHVRGDRTVLDTFIQLRDSLLEAYPGNVDQSSSYAHVQKSPRSIAMRSNDSTLWIISKKLDSCNTAVTK